MTPKRKFCNQLQRWKYSNVPAKKRNKSVKHARKYRKMQRKIKIENKRQRKELIGGHWSSLLIFHSFHLELDVPSFLHVILSLVEDESACCLYMLQVVRSQRRCGIFSRPWTNPDSSARQSNSDSSCFVCEVLLLLKKHLNTSLFLNWAGRGRR